MKILLFIPVYNCEKQIQRVLSKIQKYDKFHFEEIIVINNQSSDNTLKMAVEYKEKFKFFHLKIVTNSKNIGLGGSHKMAFQYAVDNNFDGCLILHGDDQGDLDNLPIQFFEEQFFLFGSRFSFRSKLINYSRFRIVGNIFFNIIASLCSLKLVSDLGGSGLNYFPTSKLKELRFWKYSDDLTFHAYLLLNIIKNNFDYKFFPVTWVENDQISNVKLFSQTIKLIRLLGLRITNRELVDNKSKASSVNYSSWIMLD